MISYTSPEMLHVYKTADPHIHTYLFCANTHMVGINAMRCFAERARINKRESMKMMTG